MRKLGLEGSIFFEEVKWLVDHPNLIGIFFWISRRATLWMVDGKNRLIICYWWVQVKHEI
jgi:hypothetical protein